MWSAKSTIDNSVLYTFERGEMLMHETQILMLPDVDVDSRIWEPQRQAFPHLIVDDWLDIQTGESFSDYALRCVDQWLVGAAAVVDIRHPYMLGGVGLGGVLALEMAMSHKLNSQSPTAVLLVGSCRSWDALPVWASHKPIDKFPPWLVRTLQSIWRTKTLDSQQPMNRELAQRVKKLQAAIPTEAVIRRVRLCASWEREGVDVARAPFRTHQIHGRRDTRILPPKALDATLILDGGHWINLSHHVAVNNWIEAIVRDQELLRRGSKVPRSEEPAN